MSEPQYQDYKDLPRQRMGVMANQVYLQDPKMLGIRLARYKFVSKMLSGKPTVAEIGCGDGWFSRVVEQEVKNLYLYDFDPQFKEENPKIHLWDILSGVLPHKPLSAIYSLDCFEHFYLNDQHKFLKNVCESLAKDGVFIVGIPSLESQKYASEASKEGHRGCWSGDNFKCLLNEYFANIFILGMNDETLHSGYFPMCQYLIAICTGVLTPTKKVVRNTDGKIIGIEEC